MSKGPVGDACVVSRNGAPAWWTAARLAYRFLQPFTEISRLPGLPAAYLRFGLDLVRYWRLSSRFPGSVLDLFPCIFDSTTHTPFDSHYFHQAVWAFSEIVREGSPWHVDVGSQGIFIGLLSRVVPVTFVDYRPLAVTLPGLSQVRGTILSLPFASESVSSLSSLHVVEHIGLGRYGDPLDPEGTVKAARELGRVLAPKGTLLFSLPIGAPRIEFNAHRIHSPGAIVALFPELVLEAFSGIDDAGVLHSDVNPERFSDCRYACGLFKFRKR